MLNFIKKILCMSIVAAILITSMNFPAFASIDGITVCNIVFQDTDGNTHSDSVHAITAYGNEVKCSFDCTSAEAGSVCLVISLARGNEIIGVSVQNIPVLEGTQNIISEAVDISSVDEHGEYTLKADVYKDLSELDCIGENVLNEVCYTNLIPSYAAAFDVIENINSWENGYVAARFWNAAYANIVSDKSRDAGGTSIKITDGRLISLGGECGKPVSVYTDNGFSGKGLLGNVNDHGTGKYRLSVYAYPENENCAVYPNITNDGEQNIVSDYENLITNAEKGKWNYISAEFNLSEDELSAWNSSGENSIIRTRFFVDSVAQSVYFDDARLEYLDEENSYDVNTVVMGKSDSEAVNIMVVNKNDTNDIKFIGNTDVLGGEYKVGLKLSDKDSYKAVVSDNGSISERSFEYTKNDGEADVLDMKLFGERQPGKIAIRDITMESDSQGNTSFKAQIENLSECDTPSVYFVSYDKDGALVDMKNVSRLALKNSTSGFEETIETDSDGYVKIFALEGNGSYILSSFVYIIDSEIKKDDINPSVEGMNMSDIACKFEPVNSSDTVSGSFSENGNVFCTVYDNDNNVIYCDVVNVTKSSEAVRQFSIIVNPLTNTGTYSMNINGAVYDNIFRYINYGEYYGRINAVTDTSDLSRQELYSILTADDLKLDKSDLMLLDEDMRINALNKIIEDKKGKITSVKEIQEALNHGVGIVILVTDPTSDNIKRYAVPAGLISYTISEKTDTVKMAEVLKVLQGERIYGEKSATLIDDLCESYIVADICGCEMSELRAKLSDTYSSEISLNLRLITRYGIDSEKLFKMLYDSRAEFTSIEDIKTAYLKNIDELRNATESEITVDNVRFISGDGAEYSSLNDFNSYVGCMASISNSTAEDTTAYIVLSYKKNGKQLKSSVTSLDLEPGINEVTAEPVSIKETDGEGLYTVEAYFYKNLSGLIKITDNEYSVSRTQLPNIIPDDCSGFERIGEGDGNWYLCKYWVANAPKRETEVIRGGESSMKVHLSETGHITENLGEVGDGVEDSYSTLEDDILYRLRQSGGGIYNMSCYVMPSETDCRVKILIRKRDNTELFSNTQVIKKGKWNRVELNDIAESIVTLNSLDQFIMKVGVEACVDADGNDIDFMEQDFYIDDISLTQDGAAIDDDANNTVIKGTAEAGMNVQLMIVNKDKYISSQPVSDSDIAYISTAVADENGKYEFKLDFDGNKDEYIAVIRYDGGIIQRELVEACVIDEKNILNLDYFTNQSDSTYIDNIRIQNQSREYGDFRLEEVNNIDVKVYSDETLSASVVAVISNNNIYKSCIEKDFSVEAGKTQTVNFEISADESDKVKFILIKSTDLPRLFGKCYEVGDNGLTETEAVKAEVHVNGIDVKFNPVYMSADITGNAESAGTALNIVKHGNEIKYIGFSNIEKNNSLIGRIQIDEASMQDTEKYDVYVYDAYTGIQINKSEFTYVASYSDVFKKNYEKLNSMSVNDTAVVEVIGAEELGINLTDYNKLTQAAAKRARELFIEGKPNDINHVLQIQQTLDRAVGLMLLSQKPSNEYIKMYGEENGLDIEMLKNYMSDKLSDRVKSDIITLMSTNAPAAESVTAKSVNDSFVSAYVASYTKNTASQYYDVQKALCETFNSYVGLDLGRITDNKLDSASVFKQMYLSKDSFTSIENIRGIYNRIIDSMILKNNVSDSGPSGGGGGGGGGGVPSSNQTGVPIPPESNESVTSTVFIDVAADFWAASAIFSLKNKGVIAADKYFRPNDNITREEFVKMIVVSFGLTGSSETKFSDVDTNAWYAEYISTAAANKAISGMENGQFGIGQNITRQDMALIIYRLVSGKYDSHELDDFSDIGEVSDYASEAVAAMRKFGIINGYDDNTFRPKNNLTRAESARILENVLAG